MNEILKNLDDEIKGINKIDKKLLECSEALKNLKIQRKQVRKKIIKLKKENMKYILKEIKTIWNVSSINKFSDTYYHINLYCGKKELDFNLVPTMTHAGTDWVRESYSIDSGFNIEFISKEYEDNIDVLIRIKLKRKETYQEKFKKYGIKVAWIDAIKYTL